MNVENWFFYSVPYFRALCEILEWPSFAVKNTENEQYNLFIATAVMNTDLNN
jgi:hypothetical protein